MKKNKGITLIELLVAVAVFAIMMAIAAPNLSSFTQRNRLTSQTNILVSHLNVARSEAVKRNQNITMCISNPSFTACDTADPDEWEDGWLVFIDADSNSNFNSGDTLIQVGEALSGGNTIRSAQHSEIIVYQNDGSVSAAGTFVVCDQDATLTMARAINISIAGHISMGEDDDGNGIVNDFSNTELTACT